MNPVQTLIFYLLKIYINNIFPSTSQLLDSLHVFQLNFLMISLIFLECTCSSHLIFFDLVFLLKNYSVKIVGISYAPFRFKYAFLFCTT